LVKFECTYSGLSCRQDPGFTCNVGVIKSFNASPRDVNKNGQCELSWEVENVKSCTIVDNKSIVLSASTSIPTGKIKTAPITETRRYSLDCQADDGTTISAVAECRLNVQFQQF
jgi:hypothetical protein